MAANRGVKIWTELSLIRRKSANPSTATLGVGVTLELNKLLALGFVVVGLLWFIHTEDGDTVYAETL
jgi:predicted outer membrane lipoprotein